MCAAPTRRRCSDSEKLEDALKPSVVSTRWLTYGDNPGADKLSDRHIEEIQKHSQDTIRLFCARDLSLSLSFSLSVSPDPPPDV